MNQADTRVAINLTSRKNCAEVKSLVRKPRLPLTRCIIRRHKSGKIVELPIRRPQNVGKLSSFNEFPKTEDNYISMLARQV